ncbi:MAG: 50S ribosomal protein L11 methyltransferase [bacterium]
MTVRQVNQWLRVEIEVGFEERDLLAEALWKLETIGFRETDQEDCLMVEAFFSPVDEIPSFVSNVIAELGSAGIRPEKCSAAPFEFRPEDWLNRYRDEFREFPIGDTYFVYPPWRKPSSRYPVNIKVEPSLAFGTGTHESTQLAMLALESVLPKVKSMLDVGTGSGILSIAAKKLKPELSVTALDNDLLAAISANLSFKENHVDGVRLFAGETTALSSGCDLVVANLTLELHRQLAGEFARLSKRHLIVSGVTRDQTYSVLFLFRGYEVARVWKKNDWVCFHLQHETSID